MAILNIIVLEIAEILNPASNPTPKPHAEPPQYHAFVEPSTHSVQQAMNSNRFDAKFNYGPYGDEKPGSYPIFSYTYLIIRTKSMSDCKLAVELYGYVHWFMTSEEARSVFGDGSVTLYYDNTRYQFRLYIYIKYIYIDMIVYN